MQFKIFSIVFILVICLTSNLTLKIAAQETYEEKQIINWFESKLLKVSFAKFQLKVQNSRQVIFQNNSSETIKKYRLGCAKLRKQEIQIFSEKNFVDTNLQSNEEIYWQTNHGFFPLRDEECKKGKLLITKIEFGNGTFWKIEDDFKIK